MVSVPSRLILPCAGKRHFGTSAAIWPRLQVRCDLEVAERELSDKINREGKVLNPPLGYA